ncbi:putative PurR-regulated permease PerM [Paraburkholderia sp. GV068]|nr:membrane protein [Burkholderia sp. HB1]PTQ94181.1 putative PurR-regulated permease PerM [Paraburkholderia sp. GV072]PUB01278.1 putative PurR-regulated permease PerM [Paraburkholderia sp. GV068]
MVKSDQLIERLAAVFALIILVGGSLLVLAPFTTALLWGAILSYSSWGLYRRLTAAVGGRRKLAATLIVLIILIVVLGPFVYAGFAFGAHVHDIVALVQRLFEAGLPDLPPWVARIPVVGSSIQSFWESLTSSNSELIAQLRTLAAPAGKWILAAGIAVTHGLGLLALSIILAFFFYTGGEGAGAWLNAGMRRIAGERADYLLALAGSTVKGVVYGILGTALVQGILAGFGCWIAGVPAPALLGLATFFLSVIPGGPVIVWLPAAIWLYHGGATGWAIFLVVWGVLAVGMSDNVIKPILIGKNSDMPLILVMLGILGGAFAFGFLGVFIGPTLLAVAYTVLHDWTIGASAAGALRPDAKPPVAEEIGRIEKAP